MGITTSPNVVPVSTYQYSALSVDSIRLLRLQPHADQRAPIQCHLFEYRLSASVRGTHLYEALSYVWGSTVRSELINTDDGDLYVTRNLYSALLGLRDGALPRILWVDSVCINQDDLEERSRQVQYMAEIYARASRVIVWLEHGAVDDCTRDTKPPKAGHGALEELSDAANGRSRYLTKPSDVRVDYPAICAILQGSWFERVWVLQEVAAARQVLIMCGDCVIDGYAFCTGLQALDITFEDTSTQRRLASAVNLIKSAGLRPKQLNGFSTPFSLNICTLAELVDMFHNRKATDKRDKVYALLGMSNDAPTALLPDYKITWKDCFRRLICQLVGEQASIGTWEDREIAIVNSKVHVLGKVSSLSSTDPWDTSQSVDVVLYSKSEFYFTGVSHGRWTLQATTNPIQIGDIICLLEGAARPTIVRPAGDYCVIVAIAVSPKIAEPPKSKPLDWPGFLERIKTFHHDLVLIWDWEVPWNELKNDNDDYEKFIHDRNLTDEKMETKGSLGKGNRLGGIGMLLTHAERFEDAAASFRTAVQFYAMTRGEIISLPAVDLPKLRQTASERSGKMQSWWLSEENEYTPREKAEQWRIMAEIWRQGGYDVAVPEDVTTHIVRKLGFELMRVFLDRYGDDVVITAKVAEAAAESPGGEEVLGLVLDRYGNDVAINEDLVAAAARGHCGPDVLALLIDRYGDQIVITERIVEAAARNRDGGQAVKLVLDQCGGDITMTERLVKAAGSNKQSGRYVMKQLLSRFTGRIPVDEWMLKIVAENDDWGLDILQSLLAQDKEEDEMVISEDVMVAAAGNMMHGSDMIDMLLREYEDRIVVTDKMTRAAARNGTRGKMVMQRLMKHRGGKVVPKQESR
ncbi:HET domain protein [Beauveria brongniartii RCEF 3172]|uniref:HET domain protein n=1 Tax=Beauveria brongniartii RCEF 3172 TaxID=1081107 RepID=A0A166XJW7_9HYPO|nr:HET domain protein [Beauveria brongniartii RCEF 3172]